MSESPRSSQAKPGAYDEAPLPATSQPGATGEAWDRYGDVPLGVESAWPTGLLPATA
jgi:hypothetical protein